MTYPVSLILTNSITGTTKTVNTDIARVTGYAVCELLNDMAKFECSEESYSVAAWIKCPLNDETDTHAFVLNVECPAGTFVVSGMVSLNNY